MALIFERRLLTFLPSRTSQSRDLPLQSVGFLPFLFYSVVCFFFCFFFFNSEKVNLLRRTRFAVFSGFVHFIIVWLVNTFAPIAFDGLYLVHRNPEGQFGAFGGKDEFFCESPT